VLRSVTDPIHKASHPFNHKASAKSLITAKQLAHISQDNFSDESDIVPSKKFDQDSKYGGVPTPAPL
jgi:hypothetical protein